MYLEQQFQSVLKDVCSRYPYQCSDEDAGGDSLKSEGGKISAEITFELQVRFALYCPFYSLVKTPFLFGERRSFTRDWPKEGFE